MYIFIAAILDLRMFIAVSKFKIDHFPLPGSFYIFDTTFLNIHGLNAIKRNSVAISSRLRYFSSSTDQTISQQAEPLPLYSTKTFETSKYSRVEVQFIRGESSLTRI